MWAFTQEGDLGRDWNPAASKCRGVEEEATIVRGLGGWELKKGLKGAEKGWNTGFSIKGGKEGPPNMRGLTREVPTILLGSLVAVISDLARDSN